MFLLTVVSFVDCGIVYQVCFFLLIADLQHSKWNVEESKTMIFVIVPGAWLVRWQKMQRMLVSKGIVSSIVAAHRHCCLVWRYCTVTSCLLTKLWLLVARNLNVIEMFWRSQAHSSGWCSRPTWQRKAKPRFVCNMSSVFRSLILTKRGLKTLQQIN